MGRTDPVYRRAGPADGILLVARAGVGGNGGTENRGYQRLFSALRGGPGGLCGGLPAARHGGHEPAGPKPDIPQVMDEGLRQA